MRLTIVNLYFPPDGSPTGRLAAALAAHRAATGDEVTVVTSRARYAEGHRAEEEPAAGLTVRRSWAPRLFANTLGGRALQYVAFYVSVALRMLFLRRQDLIISMTTPPYVAALSLLHRLFHRRVRLLLWNMDCYPEILEVCGLIRKDGPAARICRRISRFILSRMDHVACPDGAMVDLLKVFHAPGPRPSWSVVPNWEAHSRFPGAPRPPHWEGTKRLGLGGRLVLLHFGNAGYGHDFATLLAAAEALRGETVSFLFLGGGSEYARLSEAASRRGLDNLLLQPYLSGPDRAAALASAGMGLVALADSALGVMSPSKLHSYLGAGLPVLYLGPPGSNVHKAIERFGCGVRVSQGDVPGLVAVVRGAMADERWRKELGRRARRAFEEAYCDRAALPQLDRVIDGLRPPGAASAGAGRRAAA